jgi:hypothetical protein
MSEKRKQPSQGYALSSTSVNDSFIPRAVQLQQKASKPTPPAEQVGPTQSTTTTTTSTTTSDTTPQTAEGLVVSQTTSILTPTPTKGTSPAPASGTTLPPDTNPTSQPLTTEKPAPVTLQAPTTGTNTSSSSASKSSTPSTTTTTTTSSASLVSSSSSSSSNTVQLWEPWPEDYILSRIIKSRKETKFTSAYTNAEGKQWNDPGKKSYDAPESSTEQHYPSHLKIAWNVVVADDLLESYEAAVAGYWKSKIATYTGSDDARALVTTGYHASPDDSREHLTVYFFRKGAFSRKAHIYINPTLATGLNLS